MVDDEVRIELGGRERTIRYTANALARMEEKTQVKTASLRARIGMTFVRLGKMGDEGGPEAMMGAEAAAALEREGLNFSTSEVRALLWAGLLHEDPALTLDQAGDLLDEAPSQPDCSGEDYVFCVCARAFLWRFGSRRTRTTLREIRGETATILG